MLTLWSNLFKRPDAFQAFHAMVQDTMVFVFWDRASWCLLFSPGLASDPQKSNLFLLLSVQTKGVCHHAWVEGCNFIKKIMKGNPQSTVNIPCRQHAAFPQKSLRKCRYWCWKYSSGTEHLLGVVQAWVPFPSPSKIQVSPTEEHKQLQA